MANLFDKANVRLPVVLRPLSRLKTKLAGIKPVIAAKHFALWMVKAVNFKGVKLEHRVDRFASETALPHVAMRSGLGVAVDTALHSRKVVASGDIKQKFANLGLNHGTAKTKAEAQKMLDNLSVLQGALTEYMSNVDKHLDIQKQQLEKVQQKFEREVGQLEEKSWKEFKKFLEGKESSEIIEYQSVHQLVLGTSHVSLGGKTRLQGLKYYIGQIKAGAGDFKKKSGETDFEAALRYMKEDWAKHRGAIKEQIIEWKKQHKTDARAYQHYVAALVTIDSLEEMIDKPDESSAREARQKFLGTYGEMFGVKGRKGVSNQYFQALGETADERRDEEQFVPTKENFPEVSPVPDTLPEKTKTD